MKPRISVIIATTPDRAVPLLTKSLRGLADQTLPHEEYEVVVVSDGPTGYARRVAAGFSSSIELQFFSIRASSPAAARNLGVFASRAPVLLFLADDRVPDRDLLRQHVMSHDERSADEVAILGGTGWGTDLEVTPVMNHVAKNDQFLFEHSNPAHGEDLDFSYFWASRVSCKRRLLVRRGVFDQSFRDGYDDVELGYRLSTHGFKVHCNLEAMSLVHQPVTYEELCRRCERRGRAYFRFARVLYPHPRIERLCQSNDAERRWRKAAPELDQQVARVHELEAMIDSERSAGRDPRPPAELRDLYATTFRAFVLKGMTAASLETL